MSKHVTWVHLFVSLVQVLPSVWPVESHKSLEGVVNQERWATPWQKHPSSCDSGDGWCPYTKKTCFVTKLGKTKTAPWNHNHNLQIEVGYFLQQETILELVGISKHSTIGSRAVFKPPTRSGGKLRSLGLALISGDLPFSQNPKEDGKKLKKKMPKPGQNPPHIRMDHFFSIFFHEKSCFNNCSFGNSFRSTWKIYLHKLRISIPPYFTCF